MKKKNNVFLTSEESGGLLPALRYDLLLAEGPYPFLFTCTDEEERHTYLVVCHISNGEKTEWVAAECPLEQLIGLLRDKVSIRDTFGAGSAPAYVVTRHRDGEVSVRKAEVGTLTAILPTPGCYMDAEAGEFDEEIGMLRARKRRVRHDTAQRIFQPRPFQDEVVFAVEFYPWGNAICTLSQKMPLSVAAR